MANDRVVLSTDQKALAINLDKSIFGTFAEIGAGQEVARHFFSVGGAAGTIAKTMSAYDMTFSDEIYGKSGRYVSKERLGSMLNHEYMLLLQRLSEKRGTDTKFFVFANTVAARSFRGSSECHGWLGVRFQSTPLKPSNDVVLHVRMLDRENIMQQQALGMVGVNLLHGAFFERTNPDRFIAGLLDGLSTERIEVDMIEFSGPDFVGFDNRIASLKLLQHNLTNAIMFAPNTQVLQPSAVLYKMPVLIERGSFRPVTHVNVDMMRGAKDQFLKDPAVHGKDPIVLFEITLNNLRSTGEIDDSDFLARADTLSALGYHVLISNYSEHYRLTSYIRRYTNEMLGMVMGINTLLQIFDEKFYQGLNGGIMEALGQLFSNSVKLYIYPMTRDAYVHYVKTCLQGLAEAQMKDMPTLVTAEEVRVLPSVEHLYFHLRKSKCIQEIREFNSDFFSILSREVLDKIRTGDGSWKSAVPSSAAKLIEENKMFGLGQGAEPKGAPAKETQIHVLGESSEEEADMPTAKRLPASSRPT